ncbi:MAG: serine/threonine-protein kinase PknK [Deltaproteobacteria bacterium]|nr:serine/threonine-protein kinase PknK [Deltaproteobacteria bacterium]
MADDARRFELVRELGRGGSGIVHEAIDRATGARVAVKALRGGHPDALHRLRRECAALRALAHPNLVAVGDLVHDRGEWLLAMELIDGVDLRRALRPDDGAVEPARVRALFGQLASAVAALHAAGRVHRDLKPSNVLVDGERVVVIDLGLAIATDDDGRDVVGTPAYMAPEQATGVATEASDWYAVGAMLYEVLTGAVPVAGAGVDVLVAKQRAAPPAARSRDPSIPADLDALCAALLAIAPEARPDDAAVCRALDGRAPVRSDEPAVFVGREPEQAALAAALDAVGEGVPLAVLIEGESGIGKTALVRAFVAAARAADPELLVVGGQCRERDTVPFKGLDDVVESLVEHLRAWPPVEVARLVPARAGVLPGAFPSLRRLEAFARAPRPELGDPLERRRLMFAAMRALFVAVGERRRVIVTLDDLQWADLDSRALLAELVRIPDGPRLLLVMTQAPHGGDAVLDLPCELRRIALAPLPAPAAHALVAALGARHGAVLASDAADAVVREAGGRPMFIDELVRYAGPVGGAARLEDALRDRIGRLPLEARRVLELLAVAAAPLGSTTAARAAVLGFGAFERVLATLRGATLVRTSAADHLEPAHERIRAAALAGLDDATRCAHHVAIAGALGGEAAPDLAALAFHLHAAGMAREALEVAVRAAGAAEAALAFARAASLLRLALGTGIATRSEARALEIRLGDALASAGRGGEAARAYVAAAGDAGAAASLDLRRRAAQQYLVAGYIDLGLGEVKAVLAASGLTYPSTPRRALWRVVWQRVMLRLRGGRYRARTVDAISPRELARVDLCWTIGIAVSTVDTIRGNVFNNLGMRLALRSGDPRRISRARSVEVAFLASVGRSQRARVARALAEARALAAQTGDPHAHALALGVEGQAALFFGEFARAQRLCAEAEVLLRERCVGAAREVATMRVWTARAMQYMGKIDELAAWLPEVMQECRDRGDLYTETTLRAGILPFARLCAGDPEGARRECAAARAQWTTAGFHVQHYFAAMAELSTAIYAGDHAAAVAQARTIWPVLEGSLLLRVQLVRVAAYDTVARVLVAAAAAGAADRKALAWGRKLVAKVARDDMPWSRALAATLGAGLAAVRGDRAAIAPQLATARAGFVAADMALHALAIDLAHGATVGGSAGASERERARAAMVALGVREPERMVGLLMPGVPLA